MTLYRILGQKYGPAALLRVGALLRDYSSHVLHDQTNVHKTLPTPGHTRKMLHHPGASLGKQLHDHIKGPHVLAHTKSQAG